MTGNLDEILYTMDHMIFMYTSKSSKFSGNCFYMNASFIYFHLTSVDLSMNHYVYMRIGTVVFVTSTTFAMLASKASLAVTQFVAGRMVPIDGERVTILSP